MTLLAILFLVGPLRGQSTLHVDIAGGAPFVSIQAAINAANPGDTVVVAPGTYAEALFVSKSLTVRSTGGPALTAIAPSSLAPGISVSFSLNLVIEGFRITASAAGGTDAPGGLLVIESTLLLRDCVIADCIGASSQPAVITLDGPPVDGMAGGMDIRGPYSNVTIENCVFSNNHGGDGVGLYMPTWLLGHGGAGGLRVSNGTCQISHCTFTGNVGGLAGQVVNISFGVVGIGSGGIGGLDAPGSVTVVNSIFWANQGGLQGGFPWPVSFAPADTNSFSGITYSSVTSVPIGLGNIAANPLFTSAAGNDFSLQAGSPCIDAGVCSSVDPLGVDIAQNPRLRGFAPDMGAFEFQHDTTRLGTSEDILLASTVNGITSDSLLNTKPVGGGDTLIVHWESPCGSLDGSIYFLGAQFYVQAQPPSSPTPHIFLDQGGIIVQGPTPMLPGGENLFCSVPPGSFAPTVVRFQLFVVTSLASVLPFPVATSDAQDLVFQ